MPKTAQELFIEWLENGGEKTHLSNVKYHQNLYVTVDADNNLKVIYAYRYHDDERIPIHEKLEYQGIYQAGTNIIYDAQYELRGFLDDLIGERYSYQNLYTAFEKAVRENVNAQVSKYIGTIKLDAENREIQEKRKYYAERGAREKYLKSESVDALYECGYDNRDFKKLLIEYILNPTKVVNEEADRYHTEKKDIIYEDIIENLMIQAQVKEYEKGMDENLKCMRKIMASVPEGCKTVNVTTVMNGEEVTFKSEAGQFRCDCGNHYSTWQIASADRIHFEATYGRNAEFGPKDITKITYGKKVLYEKED